MWKQTKTAWLVSQGHYTHYCKKGLIHVYIDLCIIWIRYKGFPDIKANWNSNLMLYRLSHKQLVIIKQILPVTYPLSSVQCKCVFSGHHIHRLTSNLQENTRYKHLQQCNKTTLNWKWYQCAVCFCLIEARAFLW